MNECVYDWFEDWDDDDNSIWTLPSPIADEDGVSFYWRLRPRVVRNHLRWFDCSDGQLLGYIENDIESWATLAEAKAAIEQAHQKILAEFAEEDDADAN